MGNRLSHFEDEIRTVLGRPDCGLVAAFVHGLCNSVLVQAFRSADCPPSLYVVYREGGMTFDAIMALEPSDRRARLDDVVREFLVGDQFYSAVIQPIRAELERHFRRQPTQ